MCKAAREAASGAFALGTRVAGAGLAIFEPDMSGYWVNNLLGGLA